MSLARPAICRGCPGDPRTSGHQAWLWGGHVPPHGPKNAQLLVVGIAPAEAEELQGIPFVGPSGKKAEIAIEWAESSARKLGLTGPLRIRWMNMVNCRTRKPGKSKSWINRDPTAAEFRACAQRFLLPELRFTTARAILILGQLPFDLIVKPLGVRQHALPKTHHKYIFGLCMGHRNSINRSLILQEVKP